MNSYQASPATEAPTCPSPLQELVAAWGYPTPTRRALVLWLRNLLAWRKFYRSSLLLNFGEPVLNLVALGFGLGSYVTQIGELSFLEFIAPGLLAVTAMNAVTFDMAFEGYDRLRVTGAYDALVTAPLSIEELAAGELAWEATRSVVYGLIFLSVLLVFGAVHSLWVVLLPLVLVVSGVLFGSLALAVVSIAKAHEHLFFYFTLFITPMFMFSGVFFPVQRLPEAAQWVVKALPLYHVVELNRGLILGNVSTGLLSHFAALVMMALVAPAVPVPLLRRALSRGSRQ